MRLRFSHKDLLNVRVIALMYLIIRTIEHFLAFEAVLPIDGLKQAGPSLFESLCYRIA